LAVIHFKDPHNQDRDFAVASTESVLDCLRRNQIPITFGCKQGVCQACMLKLVKGEVSPRSQEPLRDTLRAQGYFLACRCYPAADLTVVLSEEPFQTPARIVSQDRLAENVWRVRLRAEHPFPYRAGQSVKVTGADGVARIIALASLPDDEMLEIHVDAPVAESALAVEGPFGDSFYVAEDQQGSLLLAGIGTGLAPLYAIARDALNSGHTGAIWLFHETTGMYLTQGLQELAAAHSNFHAVAVLERDPQGKLEDAISAQFPDLAGWRAYLASEPARVLSLRRLLFRAGMEMKAIHSGT